MREQTDTVRWHDNSITCLSQASLSRMITCDNKKQLTKESQSRVQTSAKKINHLLVISNLCSAQRPWWAPFWLRPAACTFLSPGIAGRHVTVHLLALKMELPRVQVFYQVTHVGSDFLQRGCVCCWLSFQWHVGFGQGNSKGTEKEEEITRTCDFNPVKSDSTFWSQG